MNSLDDMSKFLESQNPSTLNHREIENMNRRIISEKTISN